MAHGHVILPMVSSSEIQCWWKKAIEPELCNFYVQRYMKFLNELKTISSEISHELE